MVYLTYATYKGQNSPMRGHVLTGSELSVQKKTKRTNYDQLRSVSGFMKTECPSKTMCLQNKTIHHGSRIVYKATSNVWFQKTSTPPPPMEDSLICTPPSPPRICRSRGSLMTPPPPGIYGIFKRDFTYHPLEIQSGLGT